MITNNQNRMTKVALVLDGLSVGDAIGQQYFCFSASLSLEERLQQMSSQLLKYSDDTEMALGIAEVLNLYHNIDQDILAQVFARRFQAQPERGYGPMAYWILYQINQGMNWHKAASTVYSGTGSKGNGAAMRVAPIGAYFYDDLAQVVKQSQASAQVTHTHLDGQAGAIAIAVATALVSQWTQKSQTNKWDLLEQILEYTPVSETGEGIEQALKLKGQLPKEVAKILGTGCKVLSSDTVPLALWCAISNLDSYENAIMMTLSCVNGPESDVDTLCAMVGGIVAISAGRQSIPLKWLDAREPLGLDILVDKE